MKTVETALPGVLVITPAIHRDHRGEFSEIFNQRAMSEIGLPGNWAQDNISRSHKNVLRGIHYQLGKPQGKLVRAGRGAILDVAVDLRRSSSHFGRHVAVEVSEENGQMLWIPEGFGHAFLALTEGATVAYKVTDFYHAGGDRTILVNDPEINISWPIPMEEAILSEKDLRGLRLRDAEVFA